MNFTTHLISTIVILFIVSLVGFLSSRNVKSSEDFSLAGRKMSSIQVSGSIVATLVGGASTIGTSQLAFQKGINAMWFTIGASLACLFLGIFLAEPLRNAEVETISEYLSQSYGEKVGICIGLFTSLAIFIHVIGQILSSIAILSSMFNIGVVVAALVTVLLILSYIFFGGFLGTSIVGIIKTILLYITLLSSGIIIYKEFGGMNGLALNFDKDPWLNLCSDGIFNGLAQGFTLVVGVVSTQTYLQAMFAGKTGKHSKKGAYISALLIPPIGLACTLIGMFMRKGFPHLDAKEALPLYVIGNLNPIFGGMALAALIISVVGTGAGLILGICTMINRDLYVRYINPHATDKERLKNLRLSIIVICFFSLLVVFTNADSLILKWGFLSMALRGTTVFIPLIGSIYFKDRLTSKGVLIATILSPIVTILFEFYKTINLDPLYVGLFCSIIITIIFSKFFINEKKRIN